MENLKSCFKRLKCFISVKIYMHSITKFKCKMVAMGQNTKNILN